MDPIECFRLISDRMRDELVVTSAGNSSELWWEMTGDTERVFYLEASMSLSTMFAAGLALSWPESRVWGFIGDGAMVMNTGVLFTERALMLDNLTSVVVVNRCYGATANAELPDGPAIDFAGIIAAAGFANVHRFDSIAALDAGFEAAFRGPGPSYVVLEIDRLTQHLDSPPFDGPELKYRFGRALERRFERAILP